VNFSTSGFRENLFWWATAVVTVSVQSVRISMDGNFGPRDHLKRCKRPADHISIRRQEIWNVLEYLHVKISGRSHRIWYHAQPALISSLNLMHSKGFLFQHVDSMLHALKFVGIFLFKREDLISNVLSFIRA